MPNNLPLWLAIVEFITEIGYPVIAHHHDCSWARPRFLHRPLIQCVDTPLLNYRSVLI